MDDSSERHLPVHPLPDEIRSLPRNETVCKFCGVSYLIHNEIKLLEDRLFKAESELQHYKGAAERERNLQRTTDALQRENSQLRHSLDETRTELSSSGAKLLEVEAALRDESTRRDEATRRLAEISTSRDLLSTRLVSIQKLLPIIAQQTAHLRGELKDLCDKWNTTAILSLQQLVTRATDVVSSFASRDQRDRTTVESRLETLTQQLRLYSAAAETANAEAQRLRADLEGKAAEVLQLQKKSTEHEQLSATHRGTLEELLSLKSRNSVLQSELQQCQEHARVKIEELDSSVKSIRRKEALLEQQLVQSESQRQHMTAEAAALREENSSLLAHVRDRQGKESEFMSRVAATETQTSFIKEQLERAQSDCEALKLEREQMIAAHQRRIEQLRDSFKSKMLQAESWHNKLDEALRLQKEKHDNELGAALNELKQGFAAELEVEKQKCHALHEQMLSDMRSENAKLKAQIASVQSAGSAEAAAASQHLSIAKAAAEKTETSLRKEIGSLKSIIKDLEERLARLDDGNRELIMDLTAQLKTVQRDLGDARQKETALDKLLHDRANEIAILQETVRRECEERLELTEALTEAREKIALLSRGGGGGGGVAAAAAGGQHNTGMKPAPAAPSAPNAAAVGSARSQPARRMASAEELLLFKHSVQRRTSAKEGPRKDNSASASSVSISYDSDGNAGDGAAAVRLKEVNAAEEQRRRIAAALGKR